MGKFIRRLFVLLILFTIVFLVYRYINPVGASIFVEKVKVIPDKISEFIGSDTKEEINITGTTLTITGDVDDLIEEDNIIVYDDIENNTGDEDLTWLEELNLEIEKILGTDTSGTGEVLENEHIEEESNGDAELVEGENLTGDKEAFVELTGSNGKEIDLDTENEVLTGELITGDNIVETDPTPAGLTDTDYQQMEDVFGNLVE